MYSLYILSSVYFLWLKTTSKNPLWYEIFFNLIKFLKIAFTCTYACVYRPHGCAFVHWSKCLPFIAYSRDKKKLTPGLTGTFHFFHSRPFVPILGGAWAWMQIFFFVVVVNSLRKLLVFSYLLCLLPLLLQGIEHDPAQLLDVMLLPS